MRGGGDVKIVHILYCLTTHATLNQLLLLLSHLEFVWEVLLVERVKPNKFEAFANDIDRLVELLGTQGYGVGAHLQNDIR